VSISSHQALSCCFHQHLRKPFTSTLRFDSSPVTCDSLRVRDFGLRSRGRAIAFLKANRVRSLTSKAMHDPASELSHSVFEHVRTGDGPGVGWVVAHAKHRYFRLPGDKSTKSMVPNVIPSDSSVQGNCPPSALCGYSARDRGSGDAVILDGQGPVPRSFRQRRPLGLSSLNLQLPSTYILRQTVRLEDSVDPVAARHRRKTNLNLGCLKGNVTDSGSVIIYLSDSHIHDQRPTDVA
jgi:hypothetical protein